MVIATSLMATLHHIAAFTMTACLVYEFIALRKSISSVEVRRIQQVDLWYGISAGVLLVAGLLRVFIFEKGASYYGANPLFWVKMALFALVGILSIYPTIRYIRWGNVTDDKKLELPDDEYKRIRLLLNLEVIGIALILFAAPAMARAIGMN
ncbi:MAG TPA: DUF2214 family protein [Anaerolineales bacterium]|nr:DUF2214 family protein [Anaerolineales bacterium]HNO95374.1 DUF2214 family protein [Anaerolineales bacterium]